MLKARHGVITGHIIDGKTFITIGGITKIINAVAFVHVRGFKKFGALMVTAEPFTLL